MDRHNSSPAFDISTLEDAATKRIPALLRRYGKRPRGSALRYISGCSL